jgi:hypothetical protein
MPGPAGTSKRASGRCRRGVPCASSVSALMRHWMAQPCGRGGAAGQADGAQALARRQPDLRLHQVDAEPPR